LVISPLSLLAVVSHSAVWRPGRVFFIKPPAFLYNQAVRLHTLEKIFFACFAQRPRPKSPSCQKSTNRWALRAAFALKCSNLGAFSCETRPPGPPSPPALEADFSPPRIFNIIML
jgi:hypothetical protein